MAPYVATYPLLHISYHAADIIEFTVESKSTLTLAHTISSRTKCATTRLLRPKLASLRSRRILARFGSPSRDLQSREHISNRATMFETFYLNFKATSTSNTRHRATSQETATFHLWAFYDSPHCATTWGNACSYDYAPHAKSSK